MYGADYRPTNVNIDVEFSLKTEVTHCELSCTSPSLSVSTPVIPIKIPVIPEVMEVDLSPKIFLSGNLKGELDFGFDFDLGARVWVKGNILDLSSGWIPLCNADSHMNSASVTGELYAGVSVGGGVNFLLGAIGLRLDYKMGLVATGGLKTNDKPDIRVHACADMACFQGDIHPRKGPLSLNASIIKLISKTLVKFKKPVDGDPLDQFYASITYDDADIKTPCPHYGYRLNVKVTDKEKHPMEGALVRYALTEGTLEGRDREVFEQYGYVVPGINGREVAAGADGIAVLYIPCANPTGNTNDNTGLPVTLTARLLDSDGKQLDMLTTDFTEQGMESGKLKEESVTVIFENEHSKAYTVEYYCAMEGDDFSLFRSVTHRTMNGVAIATTEDMGPHEFNTTILALDENASNDFFKTIPDNKPLNLYFKPGVRITLDPGPGNGTMHPIGCVFDRDYQLPACTFTPPKYCEFAGWSVNSRICQPGDSIHVENGSSSYTVTALWKSSQAAELSIPAEVTSIGEEAFFGIRAEIVDIPETCASIGDRAFEQSDIRLIRIPNKDCKLGADVFSGCLNVIVLAPEGSQTEDSPEDYCKKHDNCYFEILEPAEAGQ